MSPFCWFIWQRHSSSLLELCDSGSIWYIFKLDCLNLSLSIPSISLYFLTFFLNVFISVSHLSIFLISSLLEPYFTISAGLWQATKKTTLKNMRHKLNNKPQERRNQNELMKNIDRCDAEIEKSGEKIKEFNHVEGWKATSVYLFLFIFLKDWKNYSRDAWPVRSAPHFSLPACIGVLFISFHFLSLDTFKTLMGLERTRKDVEKRNEGYCSSRIVLCLILFFSPRVVIVFVSTFSGAFSSSCRPSGGPLGRLQPVGGVIYDCACLLLSPFPLPLGATLERGRLSLGWSNVWAACG